MPQVTQLNGKANFVTVLPIAGARLGDTTRATAAYVRPEQGTARTSV